MITKQDIEKVFEAETQVLLFYRGKIPSTWKKKDYIDAVYKRIKANESISRKDKSSALPQR